METASHLNAARGGKERRALKAKVILNRNNAQEILKALRDLEERRPEFETRWLWELMQNARDFPEPSRPMIIRVTVSPEHIRFAHNGRAFSEDEILSLIYHGSTKQDKALLGKFGTGFLSTHLLSRKVLVRSTLVEETGKQSGFEFALDRSGDDPAAVGEAMERSVEAFERSLADDGIGPSEWTEYVYETNDETQSHGAHSATRFQLDAIPYVLAFDEKIDTIDVDLPQLHYVFKREPGEQLVDGTQVTVISKGSDTFRLALIREQDATVALPILLHTNEPPEVLAIGEVPKLFVFLPLVGSCEIGLPVAFHSRSFEPVEGRDGLHLEPGEGPKSEANKRTLGTASRLLVRLAQSCSANGFGNLQRLLRVHPPNEPPAWLNDKSWYRDFQRDLTRDLAALLLVHTKASGLIPAAEALFPVGDPRLSWQKTFEFSSHLFAEKLPEPAIVEECSDIANDWISLFDIGEPIRNASILTPERLFSTIREAGSLTKLASRLALDIGRTLEWLNQLILSVPEDQRRLGLDGLFSDQTDVGTFRTFDKLVRDHGIDDELKNILEHLGEPIRERLLHRGVAGADRLITRVEKEEAVVSTTKDLLKKRLNQAAGISASGTRTACLSLFAWFAQRGRWSDLKDAMPVVTLDRDGDETLAKTSDRAPLLLIPRTFWPEQARAFWDAFPPGSVLVDDYRPLLDQHTWDAVSQNGIVLGNLIWLEKEEITDPDALGLQLELEGEGHTSKVELEISRMALVGSEFFYESVRKNRERAARFLLFLLEYAALADGSWRLREEVPCECGKPHIIIPCQWLAWVRRKQWIPRRTSSDHLTTESLARLANENPDIAEAVTRKELEEFLDILGINILEQALLAADQTQRSELRRKLAQLTKLATQNPGEVERVMQDIERRRKGAERWKDNQNLGKAVEQLVHTTLDALLKPRGIRVETNFVGYDLAAYFDKDDTVEEDVVSIKVVARTLLAKIEIKSTRGTAVSMSYAQGQAATTDQENYWLCVVPLSANESIPNLDSSRIEKVARFLPQIGSTLAISSAGIVSALVGAVAGGFELQHVEEIRFGIDSTMWEKNSILLKSFVETLAQRATNRNA